MNWSWLKKLIDAIIQATSKPAPVQDPDHGVIPTPTPQPTPKPVPDPPVTPQPVPTPIPQPSGPLVVWDAEKIPDEMRKIVAGAWTDNQLFYALFSTYGTHDWGEIADAQALYDQGNKIKIWFTGKVDEIGKVVLSDPRATVLLISGDRMDAGGCFMVDPIRSQLLSAGVNPNQITDGEIFRL